MSAARVSLAARAPPARSARPAATIPGALRAAGAPPRVDLAAYVWSHPDGHEPRQVGAAPSPCAEQARQRPRS